MLVVGIILPAMNHGVVEMSRRKYLKLIGIGCLLFTTGLIGLVRPSAMAAAMQSKYGEQPLEANIVCEIGVSVGLLATWVLWFEVH